MKKIFFKLIIASFFMCFSILKSFAQPVCCTMTIPGIKIYNPYTNTEITPVNVPPDFTFCVPNTLQMVKILLTPPAGSTGTTYSLSTTTGSWYIDCGTGAACPGLQADGSLNFTMTNASVFGILHMEQNILNAGEVTLTITPPTGACCNIPIHIRRGLTTANAISGTQCIGQNNPYNIYSISGLGACGAAINWDFPKSPNPTATDWLWNPRFTPLITAWHSQTPPMPNGYLTGAITPLNVIANPNAPGGFIYASDASGCGPRLQLEIFWRNILTGPVATQTTANPSGTVDFTPKSTIGGMQKGVPVLFSANPVGLSHDANPPKIYYRWTFHAQFRPINTPTGGLNIGGTIYNQTFVTSPTQPNNSNPAPGSTTSEVWYRSPTGVAQTEVPWIILQADPAQSSASDYCNGFVNLDNLIAPGSIPQPTVPVPIVCSSWNNIGTGALCVTFAARTPNPVKPDVAIKEITLQPNPATNTTTLILPSGKGNVSFSVLDAKGNQILKRSSVSQTTTINTARWPNGTYNILIKEGNGKSVTKRLIVSR